MDLRHLRLVDRPLDDLKSLIQDLNRSETPAFAQWRCAPLAAFAVQLLPVNRGLAADPRMHAQDKVVKLARALAPSRAPQGERVLPFVRSPKP